MSIGDNIKKLREMHNMNQGEFGELFDSSDSTVSSWENNTRIPTMGVIQRIADYFGLKKSNIIEDDGLSVGFGEISATYDPEIEALMQSIKDRPELRLLFSKSEKATKEDIMKVVEIFEIMKKTNSDL